MATSHSDTLVDDVILLILSFCDIAGILAMSESSRNFYRLASSKSLWLVAVTDLVHRGFIDREPGKDLIDLSKEELVDKVKRAVCGPKTWGSKHSTLAVVSRMIVLPTDAGAHEGDSAKLLQGGEYLFHQMQEVLHCWSVAERRIVWTHKCTGRLQGASVVAFAVERTEEVRNQALVMTCHNFDLIGEDLFVEITALDLQAGTSTSLLVVAIPDRDGFNSHIQTAFAHPQLCGDIAAVTAGTDIFLINWRAQTRVTMQLETDIDSFHSESRLALVPGYAVLVLTDPELEFTKVVVVSRLDELPWTPVDESPYGRAVTASTLRGSAHCTAPLPPLNDRSDIWLYVHESPLQRGLFRVWIHLFEEEEGHDHVVSYELNLDGGGGGDHALGLLRHRSASERDADDFYRTPSTFEGHPIPFSGHTVRCMDTQTWQMRPPGLEGEGHDDVARGISKRTAWGIYDVSAYTGALVTYLKEELRIIYFL
ncbi:hypothetical protein C8R46DRAFT_1351042 [Mycena filopes]|nr:hypothetical protein C8R46DRAFT_1351042 [Mycena filopes]